MQELATRIQGPVAVIGDLHGQTDKLFSVIEQLRDLPGFQERWIVFLGDFVDRGPDVAGTLDLVLDLCDEHRRTTAIAGNHDLAMAASLGLVPVPEHSDWANRWIEHYDSDATFASYGAAHGDLEDLANQIPPEHGEWLAALPWCVEHPRYLFVHAGLDPCSAYDYQLKVLREKDFTLNRPQWLCSKSLVSSAVPEDCTKVVVSGHVYVPQVTFSGQRILADTTGGAAGELSCVLLPEKKILTSQSSPVESNSRSWWKIW